MPDPQPEVKTTLTEDEFKEPPQELQAIQEQAQPMHPELARRLRSFLEGKEWWQIVQLRRAQTGAGHATAVIAGIPNLDEKDKLFAHSVDWDVSREKLELTNVSNYSVGNWYYVDQDPGSTTQINDYMLGVWGWVDVRLNMPKLADDAKQQAMDFAAAVLPGPQKNPQFQKDKIVAQAVVPDADEKSTRFRVIGRIYV